VFVRNHEQTWVNQSNEKFTVALDELDVLVILNRYMAAKVIFACEI